MNILELGISPDEIEIYEEEDPDWMTDYFMQGLESIRIDLETYELARVYGTHLPSYAELLRKEADLFMRYSTDPRKIRDFMFG